MANKRVFYASQGVSVGQTGAGTSETVTGAQSVTMNTNFNLEQVFQLGRLAVYDNVVGDPTVEVSITKVLDGGPLLYNLAVGSGSLVATSSKESSINFVVGKDTEEEVGAVANSAGPGITSSIACNPIYLQSLSYNFAVDGDFTEEVLAVALLIVKLFLDDRILIKLALVYQVRLVDKTFRVLVLVLTLVVNLCTNWVDLKSSTGMLTSLLKLV